MSDAPLTNEEIATRLSPCPFCGAGTTYCEPDSKHWTGMSWKILSWRVRHWCEGGQGVRSSFLNIRAKTESEVIEQWNKRI